MRISVKKWGLVVVREVEVKIRKRRFIFLIL